MAEDRLSFLARRVGELHEQGKPPAVEDEQGNVLPRRGGDFPGRAAREQADLEWAELQRKRKEAEKAAKKR